MRLAKRSRLDFFGGGGDAIVEEVEMGRDGSPKSQCVIQLILIVLVMVIFVDPLSSTGLLAQ